MQELVAVDTGVKYHARAVFKDGVLGRAELIKDVGPIICSGRLVIECATVRRQDGHTKRKQVDELNRAAGRLGALHPTPEFWQVETWKGQVPKRIDHERTLKVLTEAERAVLPKSKAELLHVLDAIGIGLRALGRR